MTSKNNFGLIDKIIKSVKLATIMVNVTGTEKKINKSSKDWSKELINSLSKGGSHDKRK